MFKLAELFPVEALGPLAGGAVLWFAANYLFIAPELIGPRLAAKYYTPACLAAVQDGRQAHAERRRLLIEQGQAAIQDTMQEVQRQAQGGANAMMGMLFGGRPGSDAFFQRHGQTLNSWAGNLTAPALQQRLAQEQAALRQRVETADQEARRGIVHAAPGQFCGCVVSEGFKDRIELAAYTATLRLYRPDTINRLADGTMLHETRACGSAPVV